MARGALFIACGIFLGATASAIAAGAQPDEISAAETPPAATAVPEASAQDADAAPNPDESADSLNAQQQISQTVTLKRRVNGVIVDEEKETVTFTDKDPLRPTEASQSPLEAVRARFDRALLTREEARDAAKLDFVLADADRDGVMSIDEFVRLTDIWASREGAPAAPDGADAMLAMKAAEKKFAAMTAARNAAAAASGVTQSPPGPAAGLSNRDYIDAVLADFDAVDTDNNGLLRGDELTAFRTRITGVKS